MRMKRILSIVLVLVLLASALPMAVTPAAATICEKKLPGDVNEDNELTKDELMNSILPYMLDEEGAHTLDDVGDASYVYAYWNGKPKTVVDSYVKTRKGPICGRETTMYRPIERLVLSDRYAIEQLRALKVQKDLIVGVDSYLRAELGDLYELYYDDFKDVEGVSTYNPESILILNPDAVMIGQTVGKHACNPHLMGILESSDIAVFAFDCGFARDFASTGFHYGFDFHPKEITKLGYLFDKESEAEEYRDWYESAVCSILEEAEKIPEADRPIVYVEAHKMGPYYMYGSGYIIAAGGKGISDVQLSGKIDPEAVADANPEIIIKMASGGTAKGTGYPLDVGDTTKIKKIRDEIMSRPELQNVTAVKKGNVYVVSQNLAPTMGGGTGARGFFSIVYMAKWFHPDLFEDLDPKAHHQEFLTRFQGLDIDLDKQGVFVYHPTEHPDGN